MRINTNISSLMAQHRLENTSKALARALERLSSGRRATRFGDDASGLAMSERLKAQMRGTSRSLMNMNDARGFLNTAESAITSQIDLVQRMREIAIQAANGLVGVSERASLNVEFQTLLEEFQRVARQTSFNGVNLLDGTFGSRFLQVGSEKNNTISFTLDSTMVGDVLPTTSSVTTTSTLGTGAFAQSAVLPDNSGVGMTNVASGDLDGDGTDDVATVSQNGQVVLRFSNGDGTFSDGGTYGTGTVGGFNNYIAFADTRGLGRNDILVSNYDTSSVSVFLNDGNGTFTQGTTLTFGTDNPGSISVADLNSDGKDDFVVNDRNNQLGYVRLSNGDGTFTSVATLSLAGIIPNTPGAIGDFNGDNKLDLAFSGNGDRKVLIRLGNNDGTFVNGTTVNTPSPDFASSGSAAADYNGDGKVDLIVGDWFSSNVYLYTGDGSGGFALDQTLNVGGGIHRIFISDVDDDDEVDLLISAGNSVLTYLGDGTGNFTNISTTPTTGGLNSMGDYNNDGFIDFAAIDTSAGGNVRTYIQGSSSTTTTAGLTTSLDITTQTNAQNVLSILDAGLQYLSAGRSQIGATESRLDSAYNSNATLLENLSAARSQILDADMAEEVSGLVRAKILQQAGVSVLAQSNFSLQVVLNLLKFR